MAKSQGPSSDLWGPPNLTPSHHKKVQHRLRDLRLPDIECYLNEMWEFPVIEINARRRLGHINPDVSMGFRNRLLSAALDLQVAFCGVHPRHTAADTFWFWTSLKVHKNLAEYCKSACGTSENTTTHLSNLQGTVFAGH